MVPLNPIGYSATAWLCAVRLFEVQPGQTVLVTTAVGGSDLWWHGSLPIAARA